MAETKSKSSNLLIRLSLILSCFSIIISTIVLFEHFNIDRKAVKYWNDFFIHYQQSKNRLKAVWKERGLTWVMNSTSLNEK